jgi:hypothetical protein
MRRCGRIVRHVIAGFESRIAAHGCALSIADAARAQGVTICGAAFARRDTLRAIHVDPVHGFEMPDHALGALDDVFEGSEHRPALRMGQTALLVLLGDAPDADVDDLIDQTRLAGRGALWVTTA